MLKTNIYDHTGKQIKEVTLPESIFNVTVKPELISQAVHVYRANLHQGSSKVQTRGDVDRTTAKWYKQKGTGRARHGARSANIFVGGGAAHGPHGVNAKNLKLSQKMKRLSLLGVFSSLATDKAIVLVSGFEKIEAKTKPLTSLLKNLAADKRVTILVSQTYPKLNTATKNLGEVQILPYQQVNAYLLLKTRRLIVEEPVIDLLQKWLAPQSVIKVVVKKTVKKTTKK